MSTAVTVKLYRVMPKCLRGVAATVRGHQLRSWRYGARTERLVEAAVERETWTATQWSRFREEKLAGMLQRAATQVPYYSKLWTKSAALAKRPRKGDVGDELHADPHPWEKLAYWPVLTKQTVRANPKAFLASDCHPRGLWREHTSGTTGTPLTLWQSRDSVQTWYALFEARWRGWYGLSRRDPWAIIGGQLVTPVVQREPPFWVWNAALHQLYLSAYHVGAQTATAYVEAMMRRRVRYLWTYSSSAYTLAQCILEQGLRVPELKAVITNAEPLYDYQRETIAGAFQCRVFETYGMCEPVCAASECLHGRLHLWPELGVVETLKPSDDQPVRPGTPGRLVATGLLNEAMPLIRYEVGDTLVLADPAERCACGRTLPLLERVEGRNDDIIRTRDGRQIGRLDPVFKGGLPISESQIIQESLGRLRVLLVPATGFRAEHGRTIQERLRERVGDLDIVLETVPSIPRGVSGKFKAVVSRLNGSSACPTGPK